MYLQKMENKRDEKIKMKKYIRNEIIIHSIILIILFIICLWDRHINIPHFPKNFLYLTQICLYLNMIFYILSLFYNIKFQSFITKISQLSLLFNFNFCISFVVFIMYWSMLLLDKGTLYKKEAEIKVPSILNFLLHGGVFIVNLIELYLMKEKVKKMNYIKLIFYLIFTLSYIGILYALKIFFNIKIYPFIYGSFIKFVIITFASFPVCIIGHFIYFFSTRQIIEKKEKKNYEEFELN